MLFVEYPSCSTCRKAKRWLEAHGLAFEDRNIKTDRPSAEELIRWQALSGLDWKKFFNTSGQLYRAMGLKKRLPSLSESEMAALLATDGMLVKRPLLVADDRVLVGFRPDAWESIL